MSWPKNKDCTKRVGFVLWWRRLFDFLSGSDGGSCPYKKTEVEKTQFQSTFRSQIPSERAFFVTKLPLPPFQILLQPRPGSFWNSALPNPGLYARWLRPFTAKIISEKNHKKSQTPTPGSRVPAGCSGTEWAGQENKGRASLIRSQWDKKRRVYIRKTDEESKDKLKGRK